MSRPVKVLQVVHSLGMGGAETWLMELLKRWPREEVQMDFLLTSGRRDIFDEAAERLGARLHYIPYGRKVLGRFARDYRALLRRERYDAIHHHADYAAGWQFLIGLGVLPKVRVAHVHNPWLHITDNYAVSPARRLAAFGGKALVKTLATHVCGTSTEILKQYGFEAAAGERPQVLTAHCGFDVSRFCAPREEDRGSVLEEFGWPREARVVLFAGRLDRALEFDHPQNHKNSWFALHVIKRACELDPNVRFVMAGAGDTLEPLRDHVRAWGLEDQIRLVGVRMDIPRLMRAADLLLFPSRQEGLGMVAVEAQACGLPVLASDAVPNEACVVPELFHALALAEPVEAWAHKTLEILSAPRLGLDECRDALMRSGFSIENSAAGLLRIYSSRR